MNLILKLKRKFSRDVPTEELVRRGMVVGKNFARQPRVILDPSFCHLITIGNNVTIAPGAHILCHGASTKRVLGYTKIGAVNLSDDVFVGAQAVILPGVTVGRGSIVAAGSVVTSPVADGVVVGGVPARVLCTTEEYFKKEAENLKTARIFDARYAYRNATPPQKELQDEQRRLLKDTIGYIE